MGSNPVNGEGAYEDEMKEVALFENALRAAVRTQPDPRLGVTLVPRLAEAARASTVEAETHAARRRPRSRLVLVARVGIAVALIPLVLAGLAFAGVTVPEPARSAFDSIGITLPNQPATHAHSTPPSTATEQPSGQATGTSATETGTSATPSKGNSAAAHKHALEQRQKARGKALGHERGKAIGLNGSTPPGQSGQTGPPEHSNAGGSSASHSANPAPKTHPTHVPHVPPGLAKGHSK
jgi:cell division protein FtsN